MAAAHTSRCCGVSQAQLSASRARQRKRSMKAASRSSGPRDKASGCRKCVCAHDVWIAVLATEGPAQRFPTDHNEHQLPKQSKTHLDLTPPTACKSLTATVFAVTACGTSEPPVLLAAQLGTRESILESRLVFQKAHLIQQSVLEIIFASLAPNLLQVALKMGPSQSRERSRTKTNRIHPPPRKADIHPLSHQPHRAQDPDQAEEKVAATASPPSLCHQGPSTRCFSTAPQEYSRRLGGSTLRLGQWLHGTFSANLIEHILADLRHSRMYCG